MAFCPICKSNHDPNFLCVNRAQEMLGDAESKTGFKKKTKKSKARFKKIEKEADRFMFKFFIGTIAYFLLINFLSIMIIKCIFKKNC